MNACLGARRRRPRRVGAPLEATPPKVGKKNWIREGFLEAFWAKCKWVVWLTGMKKVVTKPG
jgi:hypothetical protein